MGGAAPLPELVVTCFAPLADREGDEKLRFEIDGKVKSISLRISQMSRQLVTHLPDMAIDLIELAAFVYGIDSSVSRGGLADQQMGAKWHRSFLVEVPVRALDRWSDPDLKRELEETLMFLSGDRFTFRFVQIQGGSSGPTGYFDFGPNSSWKPDSVLMFSGGLDSFAGALEEIIDRRHRVALISHFSSTKIAPIQNALQKHMAQELGTEMLKHIPMRVQLGGGTNAEGTHRSRSFLFAALGMATAVAFGRERVSFYENGVVSLNLPPVGNVLGTRATRTTHPQTLQRFQSLFSRIFDASLRVDNPFFWRTKTDVVETIARLGMADQIAFTRSCADVHNQTKQHPHCGRCSQCIDRRFAIMAADLTAFDPEEAYRIDLMTGRRERVQDKEVALSYVRSAQGYEMMSGTDLVAQYPAILNAVDHLGEPPDTALTRMASLLRRHGRSVSTVMRKELAAQRPDQFSLDSLARMFGDLQRAQVMPAEQIIVSNVDTIERGEPASLVFDRKRKLVVINDAITIKGTAYRLLDCLANEFLAGAGKGLDLLDYPMTDAWKLAKCAGLSDDAALRQAVSRSRKQLGLKFSAAGFEAAEGEALIENIPWSGYRLNPELAKIRMLSAKDNHSKTSKSSSSGSGPRLRKRASRST
ncbi:7-cyano-7-deazaguanine synthase [Puniceibacterium sp. IMCC21224]|uniref:7-cyano-7-deazaguanine synthase n=1 Tax=Puniceibacterium sp. IMCC21224 TaxID=1618204 RepID=UPI00065DA272|nr:7-cyano-7-deazaguanine synthase [Puniceibacterium sp. IMCC21224]KMK68597.1 putative PP-loop superfamily ATPase [Puniceibacterium sp. IMCC21224]